MIENIIIGLVFLGALFYLGNNIRKQFSAKSSGCAGCGGNCKTTNFDFVDLPEIEKQ
ncbi:hypothetical protein EMA8858_01468 [Emticicia aquatica]|uniref:FeoB-associated Cys-rich membrane protein n=1 Tax=Emticicia aquatica TaxID=1681835 RepID=A0ABM9ANE2_9BACT|nr:FeoB-associated Cys-rich membrane protein [Emticicia aquatica]CAH0995347.1 hypothetical protein EMA8858_01468 [Emticicia aquatica]